MNKLPSWKSFWPVVVFLSMVLAFWVIVSFAQKNVSKLIWQRSESPSVRLGVREKDAHLGSYSAVFVVTDPDGQTLRARINVRGSDFGYVTFPQDFGGPPNSPDEIVAVGDGKYSWICTVNGGAVTRGRFEYSSAPNGSFQRVLVFRN